MEREWEGVVSSRDHGSGICTFFSFRLFIIPGYLIKCLWFIFASGMYKRPDRPCAQDGACVCVLKRGGARIRLLFSPDLLQNEIGFLGSTPAAGKKHFKGTSTWCGEKLSWKTQPMADPKHSRPKQCSLLSHPLFFVIEMRLRIELCRIPFYLNKQQEVGFVDISFSPHNK